MTIQQLRAQIAALQDATMDENRNFRSAYDEGKFDALTAVDALLDSMQEEPQVKKLAGLQHVNETCKENGNSLTQESVSEGVEEAAKSYSNNLDNICGSIGKQTRNAFKAGAQWQKEKMVAKAIDAHCFGFQGAALFSFRLPADNHLVGSEVKVIVVEERNEL